MFILRDRRLGAIVLFGLLLLVASSGVSAQATSTETYTSEFNPLTFQYPSGWLIEEPGHTEVRVANTADALASAESEMGVPAAGGILIRVSVLEPSEFTGTQWTSVEMLQELSGALAEAMAGMVTVSDIETVTAGEHQAARIMMTSDLLGFDMLMVAAETENNIITYVSAMTAAGELASFEQSVMDLIASSSTAGSEGPAQTGPVTVIGQLSGSLATYASSLEDFTFQYPAEWVLADVSEDDNRVRLTNIAGAFSPGGATPGPDFTFPSGSIFIALGSSPADGITIRGLANGANMILSPFLGSGGTMGQPEQVTVDGQPGFRVDGTSQTEDRDVMLLVFENGEIINLMFAVSKAGELAGFEPQILAIAESVEPASGQVVAAVTPTATPRPVKGESGTPAQPAAQTLTIGQSASGQLAPGARDQWTFTAEAGDVVSIRMTAEFDTYLELYDDFSTMVDLDDDSGGNFNALIEAFAVPASGTYTIVASSYDRTASGPYTLELTPATVTPVTTASSLEVGSIVSGTLEGDYSEWTFQGAAGESVNILLTGEFDTVLEVLAPDGSVLASNDDLLAVNVSYVENVMLPSAGAYVIRVSSYEAGTAGQYLLSVGQTP